MSRSAQRGQGARHITIVDDEANVRLVFRTTLQCAGYLTSEAEDGKSALEVLARGMADLVLLDLRMPKVDGMEVLQRLRETGNDVPVIVISAHGTIPDAVRAMRLGAVDFLQKPLLPEVLRKAVAEVLVRHDVLDRAFSDSTAGRFDCPSAFAQCLDRAKRALNHRKFDAAEVFLRMAMGLDQDSAEVHNLLGVFHEMNSRFDDAYREYKRTLQLEPGHPAAAANLGRFYERIRAGGVELPPSLG